MKKIVAIVLAVAMVASVISVSAFAAEEPKDIERPGRMQRGENFGKKSRNDRGGQLMFGLDEVEKAIAELEDETLKARLTELVEKCEQANEQAKAAMQSDNAKELMEAVSKAHSELREALEASGIKMNVPDFDDDDDRRFGGMPFGDRGFGFGMVDTEAVKTAVDAVEDQTVKAELTELLEKWNAACEAHKEAFDEDSKLTDEQKKQLMEEAAASHKALTEALEEAGIELENQRPEFKGERPNNAQRKNRPDDSKKADTESKPAEQKQEEPAADNSGNVAAPKGGLFDSIVNWFSGLFGKT